MPEETITETIVPNAEAAPDSPEYQAALDAAIDRGFGKLEGVTPVEPVKAKEPEPDPAKEPPAKKEPAAPVEVDELTPPSKVKPVEPKKEDASSGGDKTIEEQVEEKYGTISEKPARGFKSKEEEASWARWRESHEQLKADLIAKEKAASAPPVDEGLKAQLEEALKRNEQLNSIVEQVATERLPHVQNNFVIPRERAVVGAKKALEAAGIDPVELDKLLAMPEKDRDRAENQLLDAIESNNAKRKVSVELEKIYDLDSKKAEFMADRKGNVERLTQEQKMAESARMQQLEKNFDLAVDTAFSALAQDGFEFAKKSGQPGHEKWDGRIDRRITEAKHIVKFNKDPNLTIRTVAKGLLADDYRTAFERTLEKAEKLEARIAELEGALPKYTPSGEHRNGSATKEAGYENAKPEDDLRTASRGIVAQMIKEGRR